MRLLDEKAKHNIGPYLLQCGLATITILVILIFLDVIKHAAIIATLGSSVFLVFAMPSAYSSNCRPLIGGYIIAIVISSFFYFLLSLSFIENLPFSSQTHHIIFGAIAVGLTILGMVITDTEHPPAAGMSLSLVLNSWDTKTLIFIIFAVLALASIRRVLGSRLVDLT